MNTPALIRTEETEVSLGPVRLEVTRELDGTFIEAHLTLSTSFISVENEEALRQLYAVLATAGFGK